LSVLGHSVRGMNLDMGGIVIDCAEPRALAEFWTRALDLDVAFDAEGSFLALRSRTDPNRPYLGLQKVPEEKAGKNRVHLDRATSDRAAEVARLVSLGATEGETYQVSGLSWTVLSDPAGNEFCVGTHND
jgi:hypothetical protein